jgi:hypothetical protein
MQDIERIRDPVNKAFDADAKRVRRWFPAIKQSYPECPDFRRLIMSDNNCQSFVKICNPPPSQKNLLLFHNLHFSLTYRNNGNLFIFCGNRF